MLHPLLNYGYSLPGASFTVLNNLRGMMNWDAPADVDGTAVPTNPVLLSMVVHPRSLYNEQDVQHLLGRA